MCLLYACCVGSSCSAPEIHMENSKLFCRSPSAILSQSSSIWFQNGNVFTPTSSNHIALSSLDDQTILQCALRGTDGPSLYLSGPVKYHGNKSCVLFM